MVEKVKLDAEVTIAYMRLMEEENILLARGRKEGLEEGKAEGKAEGLVEGEVKGKTECILELLEELGSVSEELCKRITSQTDLEVLKTWLKYAAKAENIEAFQQML